MSTPLSSDKRRALAWIVGLYAIVTGAMLLALSLHVRSWSRINAPRSSPPAGAA